MSNKEHPRQWQERVVELNYLNWLYDNGMPDKAKELEGSIKLAEGNSEARFAKRAQAVLTSEDCALLDHCKPFYKAGKFGGKHLEEYFSIDSSKSISKAFQTFVENTGTKAKEFGEVLTPLSLVDDMLDKLPDEVWSDSSLTWLDPCAGSGTYAIRIISRLMVGLAEQFPQPAVRYKHIINNMLYFTELQVDRAFLLTMLFDPLSFNKININIYNGSFLDEGFDNHMRDVWELTGFDIVIGNPPYNTAPILKPGKNKPQTKPLWHSFVDKGLDICSKYFSMVHPAGWRQAGDRSKFRKTREKIIAAGDMLYLEIHDIKDGQSVFGAATRYDFYVIDVAKNTDNYKTAVLDQYGKEEEVDLNTLPFIPNGKFKEIFNLFCFDEEGRVNFINDYNYGANTGNLPKEKNSKFKYQCALNINVKDKVSCIYYSDTKEKGHFGIPKVLIGKRRSGVFIDTNGEWGCCQVVAAIAAPKKNLIKIKQALKSNEFLELMKAVDVGGQNDNYPFQVMRYLKKDFWKDFV